MSQTIDKKIVQMAFENSDFEKNVATSTQSIDKLKKGLNFDGVGKSFGDISKAAGQVTLGSIADSLNNISGRFSALGILGVTTLVNLSNAAYQAGVRIFKALTIDPIQTGLGEYETKLGSIQTILANTQKEGTTLSTVTDALNQLNAYSDKTIYNFQQMTRNVGTFTAAGVKLDTSVAAIKGIANLAAVSGSNAEQASTAMYQLSQALSSGTVKLMDWNSVVNAGMGGQVFQEAIKETARVHGIAIDDMIKEQGSFRETLQLGWFTSDILTETLQKFTGDLNADQLRTMGYSEEQIASIIKLGQTANDAATKVKTFTQLFDTLKEAAQSGWAQTWEIVIGDFEEAKTFLTDLNNWLGGIIGASADARNALLQGWSDLGGRTKLLEAFANVLNTIIAIANPIKEAFHEFFPPTTAQQLFAITDGIAKFTAKIKMAAENSDTLKRIFRGIFAVIDILRMGVVSLVTNFLKLAGTFSSTGDSLAELIAKFADWLVALRNTVKESDIFNTIFENITKVVGPAIHGIIGFFAALIGGFKNTKKMTKSDSIANFLAELGEKFKAFGKLGIIVSKVFNILSKIVEKFGPIVGKVASRVGEFFDSILDAMTRGLDKIDAGKILDAFSKGFLSGAIVFLGNAIRDSKKLIGEGLFAGLLLSAKNFIDNGGGVLKNAAGILDSVKSSLESYQKSLKANTLFKIAGAIAILAAAIIALTLVDQTKLVNATAVIAGMFVALTTTLDVFDKTTAGGKNLIILTGSLIGIAAALLILSGAVLVLSKLDPAEAFQGVAAVAGILGALLLFQKLSTGPKGLAGATAGLLGLSIALLGLNLALRALGGMDSEVLTQGLIGMGAALGIIAVAMSAMSGTIAGAGGLLVAAGAILVLSAALKVVGSMSLEAVGTGLLAIAGALTILGIAGAVLTPLAPTIAIVAASLFGIGAAAAAFGIAIGAIAFGIGTLAAGIVALSTVSAAGLAAITTLVTGMAALLPMLAKQAVKAITAFLVELSKSSATLQKAFIALGLSMLGGFSSLTPQIVDVVLGMIQKLLDSFESKLPNIVETGGKLLIGLLTGIRNNIGQVTTLSLGIMASYLTGLASGLPAVIEAGWKLIISFIDGMTASVQENMPKLIDSSQKLAWAIIDGLLAGLISGQKNMRDGIFALATRIIDSFKEFLGIHSPSTVFMQLAQYIIDGLVLGIGQFAFKAINKITELATKLVEKLRGQYDKMVSAGKNFVQGFADGISQFASRAISAASELATKALEAIKNAMDAHSPSKKTTELGGFAGQGFVNGLLSMADKVRKAAENVANKALTGFSNLSTRMTDALSTNVNLNPTIRPVMDLTDIQNGSNQIQSLLSDKTLNLSLATAKVSGVTVQNQADLLASLKPTEQPAPSTNVSLTQINNSPKALDRVDIYRQTKLQLASVQRLGGVR